MYIYNMRVCVFLFYVRSTVENISIFIWEELSKLLDVGLLWEVRVNETEKNVAIYRGEHHPCRLRLEEQRHGTAM